ARRLRPGCLPRAAPVPSRSGGRLRCGRMSASAVDIADRARDGRSAAVWRGGNSRREDGRKKTARPWGGPFASSRPLRIYGMARRAPTVIGRLDRPASARWMLLRADRISGSITANPSGAVRPACPRYGASGCDRAGTEDTGSRGLTLVGYSDAASDVVVARLNAGPAARTREARRSENPPRLGKPWRVVSDVVMVLLR